MNTENISLLAQDFFDAHKDDLVNDGDLAIPNLYQKLIGVLSFSLWVVVAASGRWIGFS